jgi:hypothetical protein
MGIAGVIVRIDRQVGRAGRLRARTLPAASITLTNGPVMH